MVGAYTFDKVGPLARSAADCRTVLTAIAGPDPRDPSSDRGPVKLARDSRRAMKNLRAALIEPDWSKASGPDVRSSFEASVAELRAMGMRVEVISLPDVPAAEVSGLLITVEALASFERFLDDGRVTQLTDTMAPRQREIAEVITGADTIKAMRIREAVQRSTRDFLASWDLVVTPNFLSVAPPVEQDLNDALPYGDPVGALSAACGLPGLALPGSAGKTGLPLGFQLVASPGDDALLLDVGEAFQKRTSHHRKHPPLP
jgi:aspartyl-tRNA(Asn)/glutamyl-tRNA(Gln) amidotransferase subunit A